MSSSLTGDGVAVLRLSRPPRNSLTRTALSELSEVLDSAIADASVHAIVLSGDARVFSIGLDLDDMEELGPALAAQAGGICETLDQAGKPVVAALSGHATGAGLELALAAHARVARRGTRAGFPEIARGLLPAAGGTQRLPRLIGARAALDLLIGGRVMAVQTEPMAKLFTQIVDDDPEGAAEQVALDMAQSGALWLGARARVAGEEDPAAYARAIADRRAELSKAPEGPWRMIAEQIARCVEAAQLLPFEAGLEFERAAFEEVLETDGSDGLRHAYLAERCAARMPDAAKSAHASSIETVGVVGGGPTAAGVALCCLDAGVPVVQFDRVASGVEDARKRLASVYDTAVSEGRLTAEMRATRLGLWTGTAHLPDLGRAQLIVEAVADNLETKQRVFGALEHVAPQGAILASQSMIHPISEIAASTSRPEDVVGLFFHGSAHHARLAEVIPGPDTDDATVATLAAFVRGRLGRIAVWSGTGRGPMSEPLLCALREAAWHMVKQGVPPDHVDAALRRHGMIRGVFEAMDRVGLDVVLNRLSAQAGRADLTHGLRSCLARLTEAERRGARVGAGFYQWSEGTPHPDDAVIDLMFERVDRPPSDAPLPEASQIWLRLLAVMANAGARLLRGGGALRPSDIDAVMVDGAGFPRWRGGPMHAAERAGLVQIVKVLKEQADTLPELYAPDALFADLIKTGGRLSVMT
ncbi:3-hydroxyacyl-CoA dehydrogenase NAD-binding domain-containing protein [Sediminimonas qiaohouensis]|uniref:3-hydroxyacyl-CoA dehydrogenase NAD-binding domain-containing protein n=1 Tax=Sediminimonas qiaohouensis TaxID=552061 RepID=UPI00146B5213|nr:3-hydroxyacyl-CoA dehydrogenase NAD-binding domain-containing protein [Sediminimonas qiaohouensis]